ncbi:NUDIX domain-containing protein [Streptomyces sp. NPDC046887]|uniref:NUDIX domain-containing protein n=1 Tax=Streptomyces sp. NPDC046887 TaxID=3155472 RepID=UPI0034047709
MTDLTDPQRPVNPADEILDVVDERDRVVGQRARGEVYALGLRHRCVFVLVRDAEGRIFVHRRTPGKLLFPSHYDMFVGGVVGAGEGYDAAALREAEEELGVRGLERPQPLFRFLYEDAGGFGSWWSTVYQVRCALPVRPQVEEVAWHAFLPEEEVRARLGDWPWVPDGLAAYRLLRDFWTETSSSAGSRPPR